MTSIRTVCACTALVLGVVDCTGGGNIGTVDGTSVDLSVASPEYFSVDGLAALRMILSDRDVCLSAAPQAPEVLAPLAAKAGTTSGSFELVIPDLTAPASSKRIFGEGTLTIDVISPTRIAGSYAVTFDGTPFVGSFDQPPCGASATDGG